LAEVRVFETGATRDLDDSKYDYEGFLSPLVLERFGAYMHRNRFQKDGSVRDSDNWQKGIPFKAYMKSLLRHVFEVWRIHRGWDPVDGLEDALCAIQFNAQGYLHETLKGKKVAHGQDEETGRSNCGGTFIGPYCTCEGGV
jgi:hypothetical protein